MPGNKLKTEFQTLSARAKALLGRSETFDVEFKESVSGLESSDIVSFANSERGGTILVGIREAKSPKGQQRGQIIGCPIGDKEKLKILSKVNSCTPDVSVEIYVENLKGKTFFRIEIPSGTDKPYCTSGGTYKIRGDGITQNLNPTQLLNIFVEKEGERFLKHFREATNVLETYLESISQSTKIAQGLSDEAVFFTDETFDLVQRLDTKINRMDDDLREMKKAIITINNKLDQKNSPKNPEDKK
jgi:predicted HTH transcriptional regulator